MKPRSIRLLPLLAVWAAGLMGMGSASANQGNTWDMNVTQVDTGWEFVMFLKSDGSLWRMGSNSSEIPELIDTGVTQLAAGAYHGMYVESDGSLWTFGSNNRGQLGNGTTTYSSVPVEIVSSGVTQVSAGADHSLYVNDDGSLWAMGQNYFGQLGVGTSTTHMEAGSTVPVKVVENGVLKISAGWGFNLMLKNDGSLWAWATNSKGQFGNGTSVSSSPWIGSEIPEKVLDSGVVEIAAGGKHSLFLKADNSLWTMGFNYDGQLGIGSNTSITSPVQVVSSSVTRIAAGESHSLFLKTDGSLWTMGKNKDGQIGDGTTTDQTTPVSIVPADLRMIGSGMIAGTDRNPYTRSAQLRFPETKASMIVGRCVWGKTEKDSDTLTIHRVFDAPGFVPMFLEKPVCTMEEIIAQQTLNAIGLYIYSDKVLDEIRIGPTLNSVMVRTKPLR
jgi:alpha-tubulin suppressor-like RCC1 family protein